MIIESYEAGTPSWVDLMTTDQDAAIKFYDDLFGWETEKSDEEMGNYAMCTKKGQPVAGIAPISDDEDYPPAWTMYISVDDADAVVAAAADAGGQVMMPVMHVKSEEMDIGRMAIIVDPAGAAFGIWEPHEHKGSGLAHEPGSFTWNELLSRDSKASREFLGKVFSYEWEALSGAEAEAMDYYSGKVDGKPVLGVMSMPPHVPEQVPSYWNTYFSVAETDDTVSRAVATGGKALQEPFDSPFGRMAVLADPQGATFSIVTLPQQG